MFRRLFLNLELNMPTYLALAAFGAILALKTAETIKYSVSPHLPSAEAVTTNSATAEGRRSVASALAAR